ncbi:hypothetical protein [Vibrio mediterranei]|nr:hypothetical protein [Vibrio mediterranei]
MLKMIIDQNMQAINEPEKIVELEEESEQLDDIEIITTVKACVYDPMTRL